MKISELILELEKIKEKEGDLVVKSAIYDSSQEKYDYYAVWNVDTAWLNKDRSDIYVEIL